MAYPLNTDNPFVFHHGFRENAGSPHCQLFVHNPVSSV